MLPLFLQAYVCTKQDSISQPRLQLAGAGGRLPSCGPWDVQSSTYQFWEVTLMGRSAPSPSLPPLCRLEYGRDGRISKHKGSGTLVPSDYPCQPWTDHSGGRNKLLRCLNPRCFGFQSFTGKLLLTNTE